ncbi:RluA family pseudouridine synthase [Staphylococcus auricularis]|uniref:Pseudouridine synthase n=1 Tax=Staphylococcus auricularis TaxID=29379 RepID=A0ABX5IGQ9_9STAP|nr:RluA family pseudouridine synthase [Staphylococcus auricularis]MCE5037682.1 RluA family pseudouridine synthase [Staphylococcus auricularis]MEB6569798.1 RluA family pseudouridine synthase [Staphylococcus auricularis]PTH18674.1 RluA family pseudouridine synthase [Staphylococcus auricularis]PTH25969.1 RluA family pseudouridine synthase [Staphylococcus auricularis]
MQFEYHITQDETVKSFLQRHQYSKKVMSAIKRNGALIVNGTPVTVRKELTVGDQLTVKLPVEQPSESLRPEISDLHILYEDDYLLIVSKSADQNTLPSREHPHHSLVEQALAHLQQTAAEVPHIITRLDRNTSGIVMFAKHGFIHHLMSTVPIQKRYLCICEGEIPEADIIEAPITRKATSIIERTVDFEKGKYAKTGYKRLQYNGEYSLCAVQLYTGRTHQIRVHFQHIGHPLVGDGLYGGSTDKYAHQLLRCTAVAFQHPITGEEIQIQDQYQPIETLFEMV